MGSSSFAAGVPSPDQVRTVTRHFGVFNLLNHPIVFCIYGTFWLSYASILLPGTGIAAAFDGDADMLGDAIGIYLVVWSIITVMFLYVISNE